MFQILVSLAKNVRNFLGYAVLVVMALVGLFVWLFTRGSFDPIIQNFGRLSRDQFFWLVIISLLIIFIILMLLIVLSFKSTQPLSNRSDHRISVIVHDEKDETLGIEGAAVILQVAPESMEKQSDIKGNAIFFYSPSREGVQGRINARKAGYKTRSPKKVRLNNESLVFIPLRREIQEEADNTSNARDNELSVSSSVSTMDGKQSDVPTISTENISEPDIRKLKTTAALFVTKRLNESSVSLGNPYDNLLHLTPKLMNKLGVKLTTQSRHQTLDRYDFYYLTVTVSLHSRRHTFFETLNCELDFGPKDENEPIIEDIYPSSQWSEIISGSGELSLVLDNNLEFKVAPTDTLKNAQLGDFLELPHFSYQVSRRITRATGTGGSKGLWTIEIDNNQREQGKIVFGVVFKVPKGVASVKLVGSVSGEIRVNWAATEIGRLGGALKAKRFVEDQKNWILKLQ